MGELKDMTGQRFGKLTVIERAGSAGNRATWRCRCDCGNEVAAIIGKNLRLGQSKSCGCVGVEWARHMGANRSFIAKRAETHVIHGNKRRSGMSAEYKTWLGMKKRCSRPTCHDFKHWGGRGIRVCKRWDESFAAFLADMGPRPSPTHQIDRKDPNGHYEPGNCRWVTPHVQGAENRRDMIPIVVRGQRFHSIAAACEHFGLPDSMVRQRIKSGISPDIALTTPRRKLPNHRPRESYLPKSRR
jgi:hypothetical protein